MRRSLCVDCEWRSPDSCALRGRGCAVSCPSLNLMHSSVPFQLCCVQQCASSHAQECCMPSLEWRRFEGIMSFTCRFLSSRHACFSSLFVSQESVCEWMDDTGSIEAGRATGMFATCTSISDLTHFQQDVRRTVPLEGAFTQSNRQQKSVSLQGFRTEKITLTAVIILGVIAGVCP
jgi:hypothetical protein